ncbi:MAG: Na+/H+ antiporter NhaA [Alphaproteobacteria bacterium]|nr:Na+/H+ antiporter NhaA [Alphaproteobacteria bacterium]
MSKIFGSELFGGILMMSAAVLSVIFANTPLHTQISHFFETDLFAGIGNFRFSRPLEWWINDVLMVFFFLHIGLELKSEMKEGFLQDRKQLFIPALSAIGGMICPAVIFVLFNLKNSAYLNGWAIPTTTDIAFAVCILMLIGKCVSHSVKVFFLAVAIFDDLGVILIIALFYNRGVSVPLLGYATLVCFALYGLNKLKITWFAPYLLLGMALWYCFLNGGVHTTMAGVITAMAYPMRVTDKNYSPLKKLNELLKKWVDFVILPVFAFASAGVYLGDITIDSFLHSVTLGIIFGLFFGKQLGIYTSTALMVKIGWTRFPSEVKLIDLYGASCIAGIGFTMALFVGKLSLPTFIQPEIKIGILSASVLSALWSIAVFQWKKYKLPIRCPANAIVNR